MIILIEIIPQKNIKKYLMIKNKDFLFLMKFLIVKNQSKLFY